MSSEICQFCGIEIRFRNINGRAVPLHPTGSTCVGRRLYREEEKDQCHWTTCPRCHCGVYFVRHNGGCAWFDDLGRPWDKHACFAETSQTPIAWGRLKKGWSLCYLWVIGPLVDGTGGVFVLTRSKPRPRSSRYVRQWKMQRDDFDPTTDRKVLMKLDGTLMLLSKDGSKMIDRNSAVWNVSEHFPSYRTSFHAITQTP